MFHAIAKHVSQMDVPESPMTELSNVDAKPKL